MLNKKCDNVTYMSTQGQRIKQARSARNVNQTELAKTVGVSRVAVSQWESDETKSISGIYLFKIAEFLNVDPAWIVTGNGEMTAPIQTPKGDIDLDMMGQIIEEVIKRNLSLTPSKTKELCISIYEYLKDQDAPTQNASAQIIKLADIFGKTG